MNKKICLLLSMLLIIFISCSEDDNTYEQPISERTVLIYMAADNNLYRDAQEDILEMLKCKIPENGKLIVYLDAPSSSDNPTPLLFQIIGNKTIEVKRYESSNSASGITLNTVINDVLRLFPAKSYGLVLWSHGTGWLPKNEFNNLSTMKRANPNSSLVKSFGSDNGQEMELIDLKNALPIKFDFIIFDACLMGSIEVYYELKDKADFIIASPTETLATGLPYDKVIPHMFNPTPNYKEVAREYMDYYYRKEGVWQSATISVIKTDELNQLINVVKQVLKNDNTQKPNKETIQRYDRLKQTVFFDFEDYFDNIITNTDDKLKIKQQLSKLIIYNDFTPSFLSDISIENSCGISTYISSNNVILDEAYRQLSWYIDLADEKLIVED